MVARASYSRSRDRADSLSDLIGVTPEYNVKFDYLMHNTPFFGQIANGVDAVRDANDYVMYRVGGWDKVKRTNVLSSRYNASGVYSAVTFVSKNMGWFYR